MNYLNIEIGGKIEFKTKELINREIREIVKQGIVKNLTFLASGKEFGFYRIDANDKRRYYVKYGENPNNFIISGEEITDFKVIEEPFNDPERYI